MRPSASLEANRLAVRYAARRYKVANPRVFGSVLRGEDKDGSDLGHMLEAAQLAHS